MAELTPEGGIYTGSAELFLRFGRDGGTERVARVRRLAGGWIPNVVSWTVRDGVMRHRLTAVAGEAGGEAVVLLRDMVRNTGRSPGVARLETGMRWSGGRQQDDGSFAFRFPRPATPAREGLYLQPGSRFQPGQTASWGGPDRTQMVRDDGRVLAAFTAPSCTTAGIPVSTPGSAYRSACYVRAVKPGEQTAFDLAVPMDPPAEGSAAAEALAAARFETVRAATLAAWRERLATRPIRVPERDVDDAVRAALGQILAVRYPAAGEPGWVQPVNALQYRSFWLRDAAVMSHALDLAGLHAPAEENLRFFPSWQQSDGLFISRPGQYDGHGQALWAIGRHGALAADRGWDRATLPQVDRAMVWLERALRADPLGLVPASDPHDNELVAGHLTGDQLWALAGVRQATAQALRAGRPDLAERYATVAGRLDDALDRAARAAAVGNGGAIPPALDGRNGRDWGNLWAAWPGDAPWGARDPLVRATLAHARRAFAEGIATWGESLHGYLGYRVWEGDLAAGRADLAVRGLYATLAHETSTWGDWETGIRPGGVPALPDNLAPNGWAAAELVTLVRNMLVREAGGARLDVLAGAAPAWLRSGRTIELRAAPTDLGPLSLRLHGTRRGGRLTWSAPAGADLRWPLPPWLGDVRAAGLAPGARVLRLPGARGELRLRWRLHTRHAPALGPAIRAVRRAHAAAERP